jgi:hypothetical protein
MQVRYVFAALAVAAALTAGATGIASSAQLPTLTTAGEQGRGHKAVTFPLQVSPNGRYLETASGSPFLLVGDSPQSVAGNLSVANADAYFADRAAHGFNAVWINLLCGDYTACASTGATYDGVAPFTTGASPGTYDLSTPNSTYFSRVHQMVADAESRGIEVILDPIETGACIGGADSWSQTLNNNGDGTLSTTDKDYNYGKYLGTTFGDLPNVMFMSGNDFQCIHTAADTNNDALSVAAGIRATDPSALQSLEADFCSPNGGNTCEGSDSLTDSLGNSTGWASTVNLVGSYTYSPTYAQDRTSYAKNGGPVFLAEANYEGQQQGNSDGCITIRNCRLQEWWTMTSGATGQMYGGPCYGMTNSTTLSDCDTTGVTELGYVTQLMNQINWWSLVPDKGNAVITSGFGTCPTAGSIVSVNCVTTASDYTGIAGSATTALSYLPDPGSFSSVTVNLADFAGPVTARWYDPTNGLFTPISGSPLPNSGSQTFTPTANNSLGDKDWVLVLQGSPAKHHGGPHGG